MIQDADLEYDPHEYSILLQPIIDGKADVVYGSRFSGGHAHRILYYWHSLGNKILTLVSNMLSDLNLTDMETCYKVFKKSVLDRITIYENRFGIEPEITAKVAEMTRAGEVSLYEVGISYYGRTYDEGKKIGWKDGVRALWCIFKYNTSYFARLTKYFLVGSSVALVQLVSMIFLVELCGFQELMQENIANILSIEIALTYAFFIHLRFTWSLLIPNFLQIAYRFLLFHLVSLLSISLRILLFYFFSMIGINYILNAAIGIIASVVLNFLGYDRIVFRKSSEDGFGIR